MAHLDSHQVVPQAAPPAAPQGPGATDTIVEGGLAAPYVIMGDEEAIALVRQCYGIDGTVTRFATEKDDTFCVQAGDGNGGDGKRYVLKVANPSEDVSEIALQAELLQHIAQVDPGLPVPRILPDHAGRAYAEITDRAGQRNCLVVAHDDVRGGQTAFHDGVGGTSLWGGCFRCCLRHRLLRIEMCHKTPFDAWAPSAKCCRAALDESNHRN